MTQYTYTKTNGQEVLVVLLNGKLESLTPDSHQNFYEILEAVEYGEDVSRLVDIESQVVDRFEGLSDRVSVANGRVYFDGDEMNDVFSRDITRALAEDADFMAVVNFLEKVSANPSVDSKEQLYNWLKAQNVTINTNGNVVSYKSVANTDEEGVYQSHSSGTAFVNGERQQGHIRQSVGDVVTMPRSEVDDSRDNPCSTGLHAGAWDYAGSFGGSDSTILEVEIDPVDFVSTPNDSSFHKARICRYKVLGTLEHPHSSYVVPAYEDEVYDDYYGQDVDDYDEDYDDPEFRRQGVSEFDDLESAHNYILSWYRR